MNTSFRSNAGVVRPILLTLALFAIAVQAQVPPMISYQGRVLMDGANFNGTGQFKFALVQGAGPTLLWKNDGSAGNTEPSASVSLSVANGLVMTTLGDTTLANMTAIPASAFVNADVRLRVWFNGGAGFQQLTPDQRVVSVGYALMSGNVPDGSITGAKLANGAVTSGKIANDAIGAIQIATGAVNSSDIADGSILGTDLANNTVGSLQLADDLDLGDATTFGRLDVYRTTAGTPAISLLSQGSSGSQISTYGSDGLEQTRLWGGTYGELLLNNSLANNATAVRLTAQGTTGGQLELRNTNGANRALLEGENTGGLLTLYQADGNVGAVLYGNDAGAGALSLRNTNGSARVRAYGGPLDGRVELYSELGRLTWVAEGGEGTGGSQINMYQSNGVRTLQFDAENGVNGGGFSAVYSGDGGAAVVAAANSQGGYLQVYEEDGTLTTVIHNVADSGVVSVRNSVGGETVYLWGEDSDGTGDGQIGLKKSSGTETITLQAGEGAGGAQILMRNAAGLQTVQLDSDAFNAAGYLALYQSNGVANIILDSSDGTVRGQVVEITGGSDFSEKFDIQGDSLEPGMIVSIDPKNPGQLALCGSAHDKKVAGIVSGAGGVKPGMLMGQRGSVADGKHPVALTGRVYCWVDADANGAIEPGDMLTTSATLGHGMKVTDHARAVGAIVGKAMTALEKGKGLVLVLVNLQ
jgi:hypothetical protein